MIFNSLPFLLFLPTVFALYGVAGARAWAASAFGLNAESIAELEETMRENKTPFAAPCGRYRFEDGQFFDSVYHLVYEAGCERAPRVAEDLKRIAR